MKRRGGFLGNTAFILPKLVALLVLSLRAHAQNLSFFDYGPVIPIAGGTINQNGMSSPAVAYDSATNTYTMLFETQLPAAYYDANIYSPPTGESCEYFGTFDIVIAIGRATSADGITWSVNETPAILPPEPSTGASHYCFASHPAMVFDGTTYHVWWIESHGNLANPSKKVAYGTSVDGVTFSRIGTAFTQDNVASPTITKVGNLFQMVITAPWLDPNDATTKNALFAGTSSDGLSWLMDFANPVLEPGLASWAPDALSFSSGTCADQSSASFQLFFGGRDYLSCQANFGEDEIISTGLGFGDSSDGLAYGIQGPLETWLGLGDEADCTDDGFPNGSVQNPSPDERWQEWEALSVGNAFAIYYSQVGGGGKKEVGLFSSAGASWNSLDVHNKVCSTTEALFMDGFEEPLSALKR